MYGTMKTYILVIHYHNECMEMNLYPSDPLPQRMYGTMKPHKPEKIFPMRIVVSTIDTPTYGISEYLVKLSNIS